MQRMVRELALCSLLVVFYLIVESVGEEVLNLSFGISESVV